MLRKIKNRVKRWMIGWRYKLCQWGLTPYNGRRTDQLNFQEKWRVLEIIEDMKELDNQLADLLREAGDLEGLLVLQQNADISYQIETELKQGLLSIG